ncbi:MAG: error-prone DNA polymerase [Acidobacteria bacterium]|nr:error-prone DNA polymerase [Acidobacteriota bacterium]
MSIELHCSSAFSFLEAASLPETLVERAAALGYSALALIDRDGVYGAPRFHKAARAAGIKPIIGCELTMTATGSGPGSRSPRRSPQADSTGSPQAGFLGSPRSSVAGPRAGLPALREIEGEPGVPRQSPVSGGPNPESPIPNSEFWRLPVLVETREGYQHLCRLLTRMKLRAPKGEGALTLDDLDGHTSGLIAIVGREALVASRHGVGGLVDRITGLFGRASVAIELQRHFLRDEETANQMLRGLAAAFHVPLIVSNGVRFADPAERPLFDVLTCIRHKTTIEQAGRKLARNAERYLKPPAEMTALFGDEPAALSATRALAERIQYSMADLGYRFPDFPVPAGETANSFLRAITLVGARERYRPFHDKARAQISRELDLIEKLDLAGYFLIVWDIVNFCREQQILVQGRGSAANSAVCYSLGITAVDPVGMELLFERFLSEERGEWPDIDLDLPSGDRRERVIQHVYEKYGRFGAAMTANVITYRDRSATREVGKVLGFDPGALDRLSKLVGRFEFTDTDVDASLLRDLRAAGLDPSQPRIALFADLWRRIQDLPRHLGQHSGGMVLSRGRLDDVVPLENASMPGRVVVQWDKDDCADMGIVKIDLLGLGMMAVLQDAFGILKDRHQACTPRLEMWNIPPDDPAVYEMLQRADTVGVFQVESRAQMATLPRLKPAKFYDLVVEVALIRPGPIVGQMVHPYLDRRAGRAEVVYPHPSLEPILARTLGVPLFQEQLLRIAMVAAGFTGGQAEELRRAMGFKRSEKRMKAIEGQLREGMARQGITGEAADAIVKSIASFALYGFPESHAASFALIVYASAYLKAHFPAAFYTALLNNQPMGFYHPATLVKDAQRHGVRFAPVDVQHSRWECEVEEDGTIRIGLRYVVGLRRQVGEAIERAVGELCEEGIRDLGLGIGSAPTPNPQPSIPNPERCPKCGCDDPRMLERVPAGHAMAWFCNTCAHDWMVTPAPVRFRSLEDFVRRTGANKEELAVLAEVGALNAFGYHRREALWQIEKAVRPAGELFEEGIRDLGLGIGSAPTPNPQPLIPNPQSPIPDPDPCPLPPMSLTERLVADYAGTRLTIGPHPMAMRRRELALRGVLRAIDLPRERQGRRIRVAGTVITRQRPGTAKGFVFLTLEDETGISNIIVRPDLFARDRLAILEEPFLLIEGLLQNQEGVTSVRAERVEGIAGVPIDVESHDFY